MSDYYNNITRDLLAHEHQRAIELQQQAHNRHMEYAAGALVASQLFTLGQLMHQTQMMEEQRQAEQRQAELDARFTTPPPAPIDLRTGLYFPQLSPTQAEKYYQDLVDGLQVAMECNGLATNVVTGQQATYGQIRREMDMIEHDMEILRARYQARQAQQPNSNA
jgi:hypothetical protein